MYCSHCGAQAGGNFCSACGTRLAEVDSGPPLDAESDQWIGEISYQRLIRYRYVREQIALAGKRAPKRTLTGEQLLAIVDAVAPVGGISLGKLTEALLPIYDRMGINTGAQAELVISVAPGRGLLALLCALVARGLEPSEVEQVADGCRLTATIPSTIWSNRGEIVVTVEQREGIIAFQAATKIAGQLYDWGKSKRLLSELLAGVRRELIDHQSEPPRRVGAA